MAIKKANRAAQFAHRVNSALGRPILKLGSDKEFQLVRVPTGSLVIDRVTGGGFALGRHVELYGDESGGKSYIAYRTMALSQRRGGLCALIDPEHSFDPEWFSHVGGRPDQLLVEHPETAEEAVAVMRLFAQEGTQEQLEIVTIDSVAALLPREEAEKDPREEARIAGQARMMSRALRQITTQNKKVLFLWTNQERMNVGMFFGNPRTTPGGKALRFYASSRIELRRAASVKVKKKKAKEGKLIDRPVAVGNWVQVRATKEKTTRPFMESAFVFDTERGEISRASEIIQLGLEDELIQRRGNDYIYITDDGYEYRGTTSKFTNLINDDDGLREELEEAIQQRTIENSKVG